MIRQAKFEHITRRAATSTLNSTHESPATCRQRRHRRINMRRERPDWPPARPPIPDSAKQKRRSADNDQEEHDDHADVTDEQWRRLRNPMPAFSEISIKGFSERSHVNGTVCVQEDFCLPEVFSGGEALHFFAVYDGYVKIHYHHLMASDLYKQLMHCFVGEELARINYTAATGCDGGGDVDNISVGPPKRHHRQWWNDHILSSLRRSFQRMDRVAQPVGASEVSNATIAILTAEHVVVARRGGDSRAVLCSGGIPIPLCHRRPYNNNNNNCSASQVPSGQLGGIVVPNGHYPVDASRPQGNSLLRSSRSSSPREEAEIFTIERLIEEDEFLILASGSVWEVISDETSCSVANICLKETDNDRDHDHDHNHNHDQDQNIYRDGLPLPSTTGIDAATLLSRLALGRGSSDGIGVVVVHLKRL